MESKFTGGLLGLIGINILAGLITIVTLGIGAPWAICVRERWIARHTVIDGRRLYFDGTGAQLFGNYITHGFDFAKRRSYRAHGIFVFSLNYIEHPRSRHTVYVLAVGIAHFRF